MWVARDKNNTLAVFINKPIRVIKDDRGENYWTSDGNSHGMWMYLYDSMFPNLKWEDEPIEVDIVQTNLLYNVKHGDKFETRNGTIIECTILYYDSSCIRFKCEGDNFDWSFDKRIGQCDDVYLPKQFKCREDSEIVRKL